MAAARRTRLDRLPASPLPSPSEVQWVRRRLRHWWSSHAREFPWRHSVSEYETVIAEVLLQQTTAKAASAVFEAFVERYPAWSALAQASPAQIATVVGVLGLGERRSQRLADLARWVVVHGGDLPSSREDLEAVPGIGQYVASAVLAARGHREPLLDVNMARVIERFTGVRERAGIREDPWLQHASRRLFPGLELGWAVLDLAALVCRARGPRCSECPLESRCAWAAQAARECVKSAIPPTSESRSRR